jgi:hypothetical protein
LAESQKAYEELVAQFILFFGVLWGNAYHYYSSASWFPAAGDPSRPDDLIILLWHAFKYDRQIQNIRYPYIQNIMHAIWENEFQPSLKKFFLLLHDRETPQTKKEIQDRSETLNVLFHDMLFYSMMDFYTFSRMFRDFSPAKDEKKKQASKETQFKIVYQGQWHNGNIIRWLSKYLHVKPAFSYQAIPDVKVIEGKRFKSCLVVPPRVWESFFR